MLAIAFLGGWLVTKKGDGAAVIPLLGLLALGAQRLLPALQTIYSSWVYLKGNSSAIQVVLKLLDAPLSPQFSNISNLRLRDNIVLSRLSFRYGIDQPNVLKGLDLEIRRGERIGLIGTPAAVKAP